MSNVQDQTSSSFDNGVNDHEYFASTVETISIGRDPVTQLATEPPHVFDLVWNMDLNTHLADIRVPYVLDLTERSQVAGIVDSSKYIYNLGTNDKVKQIELKKTNPFGDVLALSYTDANGSRTGNGANEDECMVNLSKMMSTDGINITLLAADGSQNVGSSMSKYLVAAVSSGVGNSLVVGGANTFSTYTNFAPTGNIPNLGTKSMLFATNGGSTIIVYETDNSLAYRSTDSGVTFTNISAALSNVSLQSIAYSTSSNLFVGISSGGLYIYRSMDDGVTWTSIPLVLPIASTNLYYINVSYSTTTSSFWINGSMYSTTDGITITHHTNNALSLYHEDSDLFTDSPLGLIARGIKTSGYCVIKYNASNDDWDLLYDSFVRTISYNSSTSRLIMTDNMPETIYSTDGGVTFTKVSNHFGVIFDHVLWLPEIDMFACVSATASKYVYYTKDGITVDHIEKIDDDDWFSVKIIKIPSGILFKRNGNISRSITITAKGQSAAITKFMTALKSQMGVHNWYTFNGVNPQSATIQVRNGLAQLFDRDPQLNNLIGSAATSSTFLDSSKIQAKMQNYEDTFYTKLFSEQQLREVLEAVSDRGSRVLGVDHLRSFNFTAGDSITAVVKFVDSDSSGKNTDRWLVTLQQT
jgi:hypothetical protein